MATNFTSAYTGRDPSSTGTQKRSVHDKIRNLFPGASTFLALVAYGEIKKGELTKRKGMISKTTCSQRRYEWFTYTPWTIEYTVSKVEGANITLAASNNLAVRRCVLNLSNMDVARVVSLANNVITVASINDAAFTVAAGDKLLALAPAYEENSENPAVIMKDEDNQYNVMQIVRFPVSISASAKTQEHFGMENIFSRLSEKNMIEGMRLVEHSMLFSERAYTTTTDLTEDSTNGSFGTMRGLWNWAQKSFDCGGAMTPEKFIKDLPLQMSDTINDNQKVVMLCGRKVFGEMQMWAADKWMYSEPGDMEKYGVTSKKFQTSGPEIEVVKHAVFDRDDLSNKALIFCPEDLVYVAKKGRDIQPRKGIQSNSRDGYEDEIFGELTIAELTGGLNVCKVTDWFVR